MHRPDHPSAQTARALPCIAAALLAGCVGSPSEAPPAAAPADQGTLGVQRTVFEAGDALERDWRKVEIWGTSRLEIVAVNGEPAIRAGTEGSSAALVRRMEIDVATCPVLEWSWRVDAMPPEADLASRAAEDVAASIFFAFGDPGTLTSPDPVPTLRYAWATAANPVDAVIESPYFPDTLRTVVVRSGGEPAGTWVEERRDLLADYRRAFGSAPEGPVELFALFTDGDHGEAPVEAHYRRARVLCTEGPEPPSIFTDADDATPGGG